MLAVICIACWAAAELLLLLIWAIYLILGDVSAPKRESLLSTGRLSLELSKGRYAFTGSCCC